MQTETKYSQGMEEPAILDACGTEVGRFLDIGAWNAKTFSNTRALYERGWSGVMIEPSPEPFLNLLREYGTDERISLINAAIGPAHEIVEFFATADATSTTDREHYEKWKRICKFYGKFFVQALTLGDVLNQFGNFQMVNIDAEGISANILLGLLETAMRPLCICVEHDNRQADIRHYANEAGYDVTFENGENLVLSLRR